MDRWPAFVAVAAAGLGLVSLVAALDARRSARRAGDDPAAHAEALRDVASRMDAQSRTLEDIRREMQTRGVELAAAQADVRRLSDRLAAVESGAAAGGAADGAAAAAAAPKSAADDPTARAEFEALRKKFFEGKTTDDEMARFWELARTTGLLGEVIGALERAVASRPGDVDARMSLAQAYVTKLLTVPDGPERGTWAMKAERQWQEVLRQDANHWDARFSLAFSWSQWPDFLNKTPDAIREFETLRDVQERSAPDEKHAGTYLNLSLLYRRQGRHDEARAALEAGLRRHPEDAELRKALESTAGAR